MTITYDNQFNELIKEKRNIENKYYEKSMKRMQRGLYSAMSGAIVGMGSIVALSDYANNNGSNIKFLVNTIEKTLSSSFIQNHLPDIANMDTGMVIIGTGAAVIGAGFVSLGINAVGSKLAKNVAENIFTDKKLQEKYINKPLEKVNNEFKKMKNVNIIQKAINKVSTLFKNKSNIKEKNDTIKENKENKDEMFFSSEFSKLLSEANLSNNESLKRKPRSNNNKHTL